MTRLDYLIHIYQEGSKRLDKELCLERLITQIREIKVFMKKQESFNEDARFNLQFEP